ncbi:MAG: hypothetical protein ABH878_00340 [bacterium]
MRTKFLRFAVSFLHREEGSFPMLAMIMIVMLIFTGLAFMKWGADEGWEAMRERAKLQAYYAAHADIMDRGINFLENLNVSALPQGGISLGGRVITDTRGAVVARTDTCWLAPGINQGGTAFFDFNYIKVGSRGVVDFQDYQGNPATVSETSTLTVKLLNLANFLYLTDEETTVLGERIKFWGEDTLDGWVHSNDTIAIMQSPVFYDRVTTTAPVFWQGPGFNPIFVNYPPIFEYREIELPDSAVQIRNAASSAGLFFDDNNGTLAHRLEFRDQQGWVLYSWPMGQPFQDSVRASGPPFNWQAIFVNGYLELKGIVRGQVTVGAKGNANPLFKGKNCIRLMDDIRYWFASSVNGSFNDTTAGFTDILGIVSEGNIVIANTNENGRENQSLGSSIIITGAMIALGESFSFEDQNDNFIWEFSTGYVCPNPPTQDERGDIYEHGAITQYRRGYVHRSNHGGTGYGKEYHFDNRLSTMAPPYFLEASDEEGNAFFEIISWGEHSIYSGN